MMSQQALKKAPVSGLGPFPVQFGEQQRVSQLSQCLCLARAVIGLM
jgi:hypothetical protein